MLSIKNYYISGFVLFMCLLTCPGFISADEFEISRFIKPVTCGDCHVEIYSQWQNSMHSLSQKDPIYLKVANFLRDGLTDKNEIAEAESCVKCHVPVGYVTGYPKKLSDDIKKIPKIVNQGIQCDYCHTAINVGKMYNNGLKLAPGNGEDDPGIKRGPFRDSESDFHKSEYSELHIGSKICGTCHNVKHVVFKTDLETTYQEWSKSPYNSNDPKKRIECQECHMYQRPGIPATGSTKRPKNKGTAAEDGPERDHIYTHYFVGGNRYVPGDSGDDVKRKMSDERLKNTASIDLDTTSIKKGMLGIKITNTGAGHYLPTGLTDVRQMWLCIIIKNENGKEIFTSGVTDNNNYIPEGTMIYNTEFGDGKGNKVINIAKAKEVLKDHRIPPLASVTETITLPEGKWKNLTISIKLLYRSAPQKILDIVVGKGKLKLPVVNMVEVEKKI